MICTESRSFFEISMGPQPDNTFKARIECLKDFLKRMGSFPFAVAGKALRTFGRSFSVCFAGILVLLTLGGSKSARDFFVDRIVVLAKDFADWVLLPFAVLMCFFRLVAALLVHPDFYFNTF